MTRLSTFAAATVAALSAAVCLSAGSRAQTITSDEAYCRQLVDEYSIRGMGRGFDTDSLDTAVAISQCRDGNPGPAIPVLQSRLRAEGFTVPPKS